ncbi:hypothetical protein ACFO5T_00845 [Dokdonia genika]|uniref:Lipoprotein n=1 Tax=Dokdonia genika TaxID=308113 RepID=A0ABV9L4G9_9FLAO
MQKIIYLLIFIILCSCKTKETELKKEKVTQSDFLKSKSFDKAKNQFGKFVDFTFDIDTLNKILYDKTDFYKLNITAYDSIYIGKRNDTIFSYDQSIPFKEIFVVLDKEKKQYLGRLGADFGVYLTKSNDSIFHYSFNKIIDDKYDDHIMIGFEYPELTISKMEISKNGKIIDLTIEQTENKK